MKNEKSKETTQTKADSLKVKRNNGFYLNRDNFIKALDESGMSQKKLAELVHRDKSSVNRWIAVNQSAIDFSTLLLVSKVLNVSYKKLIGESKSDNPELLDNVIDNMRLERQVIFNLLLEQGIEVIEEPSEEYIEVIANDKNGDAETHFDTNQHVMKYYIRYGNSEPLPISENQLEFLCNQAKRTVACLFESYRDNYSACFSADSKK